METEGEHPEEEELAAARELIQNAFKKGEDQSGEHEPEWTKELLDNYEHNSPREFLDWIIQNPHCDIVRYLAFNAKEGDIVPDIGWDRDLRPYGQVQIINGKTYVGGWHIDPLGFFAEPGLLDKPEGFDWRKKMWLNFNILGTKMMGETEEEHRKRIEERDAKIERYWQEQAEKGEK